MSRTVKLVLYIICVTGVVVFGALTVRAYRKASNTAERGKDRLNRIAATTDQTNVVPATNITEAVTNAVEPATNETTAITNPVVAPSTNTSATNITGARKDE